MASDAAPHSPASICRITGVRLIFPLCDDFGTALLLEPDGGTSLSIKSRHVLDERDDQIERALPPGRNLGTGQRTAGQLDGRSVADGPAIACCGCRVRLEDDGRRVRRAVTRETRHQ